MSWQATIARWLAPQEFEKLAKRQGDLDMEVNQRVADVIMHMDPFEPLLRQYNVVFPAKWSEDEKPEDELGSMQALQLYMWAYGQRTDVSFKHLTDWVRNHQGNATLRKGSQDKEWFYGRSAIATMTLFVREIGRLSSKYEEVMLRREPIFDAHLPTGEY